MRKTIVICLSALLMILSSGAARADYPVVEWNTNDSINDSFSQQLKFEHVSPDTPLLISISTNHTNETSTQGEMFSFFIVQNYNGQSSVSFSLTNTKSLVFKSLADSKCSVVGQSVDRHDIVCTNSIPEGLLGQRMIEIVPSGLGSAGTTSYTASWKNLSTNKSYPLGEIQSSYSDNKFMYVTEMLMPRNAVCESKSLSTVSFKVPTTIGNSEYTYISGFVSPCKYFKYYLPSTNSKTKKDWIQISVGLINAGPEYYNNTIYEITHPEIWKTAGEYFKESLKKENEAILTNQQNKILASLNSLTLKSEKLEQENQDLLKMFTAATRKIQKVCGVRVKPKGCA